MGRHFPVDQPEKSRDFEQTGSGLSQGKSSKHWKTQGTRMHSSRMRTVRSSSRVYPSMEWAWGCVSQHAVDGGCVPGGCIPACTEADPPPWTEFLTPLWKYYLAATLLQTVITDKFFFCIYSDILMNCVLFAKMDQVFSLKKNKNI